MLSPIGSKCFTAAGMIWNSRRHVHWFNEANDFYSTVSHRLHDVGVEKIVYRWQYETLPLLKATKDIESLQEIRQPFFSIMDGQDVPDGFVPPEEGR